MQVLISVNMQPQITKEAFMHTETILIFACTYIHMYMHMYMHMQLCTCSHILRTEFLLYLLCHICVYSAEYYVIYIKPF